MKDLNDLFKKNITIDDDKKNKSISYLIKNAHPKKTRRSIKQMFNKNFLTGFSTASAAFSLVALFVFLNIPTKVIYDEPITIVVEDNNNNLISDISTTGSIVHVEFDQEYIKTNHIKSSKLYLDDQFIKNIPNNEFTIDNLIPNIQYNNFNIVVEKENNYLTKEEVYTLGDFEIINDEDELSFNEEASYSKGDVVIVDNIRYLSLRNSNDSNIDDISNWEEIINLNDSFEIDTVYTEGDIVTYNGLTYSVKWWTKGILPLGGDAFELVSNSNTEEVEEWSYNITYQSGSYVVYENKIYKSKWITRNEMPTISEPWQFVKEVNDSDQDIDIDNIETINEWNKDLIYNKGDLVIYNNINYKANWWTQGAIPTDSDDWERLDKTDTLEWNKNAVYHQGDIVSYEGNEYMAKWWTKDEIPNISTVWELI